MHSWLPEPKACLHPQRTLSSRLSQAARPGSLVTSPERQQGPPTADPASQWRRALGGTQECNCLPDSPELEMDKRLGSWESRAGASCQPVPTYPGHVLDGPCKLWVLSRLGARASSRPAVLEEMGLTKRPSRSLFPRGQKKQRHL